MKNLEKTKAYDLRDLNDEQKKEVLNYLQKNEPDSEWSFFNRGTCFLYSDDKEWYETYSLNGLDRFYNVLVNALELFELQIGDTFEYNGYICEVKEPIKRWYYNEGSNAYIKSYTSVGVEITNQQLIKLLEENEIH